MKTPTRLVTLITLGAILGFMFASVSCTSLSAGTQAKLDHASQQYESATGISAMQTVGLMGKWWQDYQQAKVLNALLQTDVIQATKASPITSTKSVIDVRPMTSYVAPESPAPAPSPTDEQPKKRARPGPRDPRQMLAAH